MKKIVISDLDGTLLNSNHVISQTTQDTIKKLQSKGIDFAIATGRDINDVKNILKDTGIKCPIIGCNGGTFHDENFNLIYEKFLDDNIAKKVFNFINTLVDEKTAMHVIKDGEWFIFPTKTAENRWDATHKTPKFVNAKDFVIHKINKIFVTTEDELENKLEKIREYIVKENIQVNYAYTFEWCFEVFPQNLNKYVAIQKLLEIKGYNPSEVVAFGDGMNDYEMLKNVGTSFIMKNASNMLKDSLKDKEIIDYNYNNAVANKLKELFELD